MNSFMFINRFVVAVAFFATATFSAHADQQLVVKNKNGMPPAQLGISPPRIEHTLVTSDGKRIDESLVIFNYNDKPKNIRLTFIDVNKKKSSIKPNKNTLSPWVIVNPQKFVIPANGQQTVRLSIRPPVGFAKKTHYAMLKVENYVDDAIKMDKNTQSVVVTLGSSYGLPIIVRVK